MGLGPAGKLIFTKASKGWLKIKLKGKIAIVTGAASGLGLATAQTLLADGASVALFDINPEVRNVAKELNTNGNTLGIPVDIGCTADVATGIKQVIDHFGRIDILVNNAAVELPGTALTMSVADWERTLNVNLTGSFLMAKHVLPYMIEQKKGYIINISSVLGKEAVPDRVAYCTTKAALIQFTRSLAADFSEYGIICNCVLPGAIVTDSLKERIKKDADPIGLEKLIVERTLAKRMAAPQEIAALISFLVSGQADYMIGSPLLIDGGQLAT